MRAGREERGRPRRAIIALALLAGLGACDDSVRFRLRLEWQRQPLAQACPTTPDGDYSCTAIPLSCDVKVRVRIESISDGHAYVQDCYTIQSDGTACQLGDLPILPRNIPNEMVRVQVIVWTLDELRRVNFDPDGLTDGCPASTEFTTGGLPRLGEDPTNELPIDQPVPSLGGETYFAVGESPVATVTLGCPRWDSLDAASCQGNAINIEARIRNPSTFGSVSPADADRMDVRFGEPQPDGQGGFRADLSEQYFTPALSHTVGGALVWQGTLTQVPSGTRCLRADHEAAPGPTISCFPIESTASPIRVDGFLVGRLMLRDLLDLQGITDVPEEGLVFGVVVDAANQPVQGATVSTTDGATVVYPANDLQTVGFMSTDSKGYFLSMNARYESMWRASGPGILMGDGEARGGLVNNHVSVVVIKLTGVVQPPIDAGIGGGDPDAGVDAP